MIRLIQEPPPGSAMAEELAGAAAILAGDHDAARWRATRFGRALALHGRLGQAGVEAALRRSPAFGAWIESNPAEMPRILAGAMRPGEGEVA